MVPWSTGQLSADKRLVPTDFSIHWVVISSWLTKSTPNHPVMISFLLKIVAFNHFFALITSLSTQPMNLDHFIDNSNDNNKQVVAAAVEAAVRSSGSSHHHNSPHLPSRSEALRPKTLWRDPRAFVLWPGCPWLKPGETRLPGRSLGGPLKGSSHGKSHDVWDDEFIPDLADMTNPQWSTLRVS